MNNRRDSQAQAMINQAVGYGGLDGIRSYREKDPSVTDAQDAIAALRKRLDIIKGELARLPRLQAEQARIERMLAAAAGDNP